MRPADQEIRADISVSGDGITLAQPTKQYPPDQLRLTLGTSDEGEDYPHIKGFAP